jgi:hypothetical protein
MGYESYVRKRRTSVSSGCHKSTGKHRHSSSLLNLKVVDVFSFHLQIFHWFIAPPSRRYFEGHSSRENPTLPNPVEVLSLNKMKDTCASFFLYLKGGLSREDFLGENVAVFVSVEITYEERR